MTAYRARSGSRESAAPISCHARRWNTEGSTGGSIAAAVMAQAQGRSVGIAGWVEVAAGMAAGVTCWEGVVPVLGILVADEARSGCRESAPHSSRRARRRSTEIGTIDGRAVVTMGHLKGGSVRVVRWVEIAVDVTMRVATIVVLRRESSIVALIKDTDRGTDIAESVTNVAGVNMSVMIGTTGTEVEAVVGIKSGCSWLNSTVGEARNSNFMVSR